MRISLVLSLLALSLVACTSDYGADGQVVPHVSKAADSDTPAPAKSASTNTAVAASTADKSAGVSDAPVGTPPSAADAQIAAPPAPAKVAQPNLVSMMMHFTTSGTSDWLMSRTAGEGAPKYVYNGISYRVMDAPPTDADSLPLYRCIDVHGTHYQSNLTNCEGVGTNEGLLGFVYTADPGNGAVEIIRCIGASGYPIVSTIEHVDCDPFIVQGPLGYAFPRNVSEVP